MGLARVLSRPYQVAPDIDWMRSCFLEFVNPMDLQLLELLPVELNWYHRIQCCNR